MEKLITISIASLMVISLCISCSKEPLQKSGTSSAPPPVQPSLPPPYVPNYPTDSLTGKTFVFTEVLWVLDSDSFVVCNVNRPDLFYSDTRPMTVRINLGGIQWIEVFSCIGANDPFSFVILPPGILKLYNYPGDLLGTKVTISVKFL